MSQLLIGALVWSLLAGGAFACLYGFISFTDPQFRNRRHGYLFTGLGLAALAGWIALWLGLR